ncbi:MAG: T9SS type A sorting domain-containing protein [Candidatus Kapabacteria bacterium]|nr:T9SS type A sorting domain-containing protein [Candidatus Kapabacteria bacterium]
MKFYQLCIAVVVAAMTFVSITSAEEWKPTDGPHGAVTQGFFTHGASCYSLINSRLYRHTAQGWEPMGIASTTKFVSFRGSMCGIGYNSTTYQKELLQSTDEGKTFTATALPEYLQGDVMLQAGSAKLYAMDNGRRDIYTSTDGKEWVKSITAPDSIITFNQWVVVNDVIVVTSGFQPGVWLSTDGGATFSKLPGMETGTGVALFAAGPYLGISSNTSLLLIKNADFTNVGIIFGSSVPTTAVAWDGTHVIARVGNTIRRIIINQQGVLTGVELVYNALDNATDVLATTNGTICRARYNALWATNDVGTTWRKMPFDMNAQSITAITASGSTVFCSTSEGLYRTTNGGTSWVLFNKSGNEFTPAEGITEENRDVESYFAVTKFGESKGNLLGFVNGGFGATDGSIVVSTNGGASWRKLPNLYENSFASDTKDMVATPNGVFACAWYIHSTHGGGPGRWATGGIMRSTDGGVTWRAANNGLPARDVPVPTSHLAATNTTLFAWTVEGMFRSINNGDSWQPASSGLNPQLDFVTALVGHENVCYMIKSGGGIMTMTDGESTWTSATLPASGLSLMKAGAKLFAMKYENGTLLMYRKTATGWDDVSNDYMFDQTITGLAESGGAVFAGTSRASVWRKGSTVVSSVADGETADNVMLVMPNPAVAQATVTLPAMRGGGTYTVSDMNGRVVMNGTVADGTNVFTFPTAGLAAGSYSVHITDGSAALNGVTFVVLR